MYRREACTVGDKTPPGVIKELFGLDDDTEYPHLFRSCIAGGIIGVDTSTPGGQDAVRLVLRPTAECALRRRCIYPNDAVAIVNTNFDMAPIGLLVHAAGLRYFPSRRFNAAMFTALHTSEDNVENAGVVSVLLAFQVELELTRW